MERYKQIVNTLLISISDYGREINLFKCLFLFFKYSLLNSKTRVELYYFFLPPVAKF